MSDTDRDARPGDGRHAARHRGGGRPLGATHGQAAQPLADTWDDLRRKPIFWISLALLILFLLMAAFPPLFTDEDPRLRRPRQSSLEGPSADAWFGFDLQGRDVYARTIYGARASIIVGVLATLGDRRARRRASACSPATTAAGWTPSSPGSPTSSSACRSCWARSSSWHHRPGAVATRRGRIMAVVIVVLAVLGWPILMRIARSVVIQAKQPGLRAGRPRAGRGPDCGSSSGTSCPTRSRRCSSTSTITIGSFIGAEATLSLPRHRPAAAGHLVGHRDRRRAPSYSATAPHLLLFPAGFLP